MLRVLFAATAALALCAQDALACAGQTGKVIFEDNFTDDSGGWAFSVDAGTGLLLKAPGAAVSIAPAGTEGSTTHEINQTFTATLGDFCVEGSFPANLETIPGIGVLFWAADVNNVWTATAYSNGEVRLANYAANAANLVFNVPTNNVVKTGPTDLNSVRAVVKNGTITVIVNGQTIKSIRAQIPAGNLKFGLKGSFTNASTEPVLVTVTSYKVTAVQ